MLYYILTDAKYMKLFIFELRLYKSEERSSQ